MNNPNNPFVPKGTLLDLQGRRRSQLKIAVFCVVAVGVASLSAMLIQGCERKKPVDETTFTSDLGTSTNLTLAMETNGLASGTNPPIYNPPVADTNIVTPPPIEQANMMTGSEYKVAKGDTMDKIAKKFGVSPKALKSANPHVNPNKMKINEKLVIPAPTLKASAAAAPDEPGSKTYTVKPGDSLGKIAKSHGTTVTAIKAANSLSTDRINVKQILKIPSKAETAPALMSDPAPPLTVPPVAPGLVK